MNFTREPIVETVITPKEGYKLVVRNSKGPGQEEFFVDAVEVISFGSSSFFRSLEKPKCFLVPVNDYEILEVREARMVLKTTSLERGVKIGGGRENAKVREKEVELATPPPIVSENEDAEQVVSEQKVDKKRERRRFRKKKGKLDAESMLEEEQVVEQAQPAREFRPSLIPPPPTLISETLGRRRENSPEDKEEDFPEMEEPPQEPQADEQIPF